MLTTDIVHPPTSQSAVSPSTQTGLPIDGPCGHIECRRTPGGGLSDKDTYHGPNLFQQRPTLINGKAQVTVNGQPVIIEGLPETQDGIDKIFPENPREAITARLVNLPAQHNVIRVAGYEWDEGDEERGPRTKKGYCGSCSRFPKKISDRLYRVGRFDVDNFMRRHCTSLVHVAHVETILGLQEPLCQIPYKCPLDGCTRSYRRRDQLNAHLEEDHSVTDKRARKALLNGCQGTATFDDSAEVIGNGARGADGDKENLAPIHEGLHWGLSSYLEVSSYLKSDTWFNDARADESQYYEDPVPESQHYEDHVGTYLCSISTELDAKSKGDRSTSVSGPALENDWPTRYVWEYPSCYKAQKELKDGLGIPLPVSIQDKCDRKIISRRIKFAEAFFASAKRSPTPDEFPEDTWDFRLRSTVSLNAVVNDLGNLPDFPPTVEPDRFDERGFGFAYDSESGSDPVQDDLAELFGTLSIDSAQLHS
ncbi:hypothetical protein EIP91_010735 [Steccherinum ochraceum]|uniref:C2H2-type domain-containing protein n=1 Tax=Steccherinum ochraceum TaxID=92696 RepID=A0A4R0RSH9_9APHY|nr:hypothetical protein EIP91_010735 [Steccherinum ochraceum]